MRRGRVLLVRHAGTSATRGARFPGDEPLSQAGWSAAGAAAVGLERWLGGQPVRHLTSPALRADQTARALGLRATVEPELRPLDLGRWTGRSLPDVAGEEPAGLRSWRTEPDSVPHGGESLSALLARGRALLATWSAALASERVALVAVTHGAVLRALVASALGLPPLALWQLEAAPATAAALHLSPDGGWSVAALNLPLGALAEGEG